MSIGLSNQIDEWQVNELTLYYQNDSYLYNNHLGGDWFNNYKRKIEKGIFDRELAIKGLMIFVDHVIQRYRKEFGEYGLADYSDTNDWRVSSATKKEVAKNALEDLWENWELGKVRPVIKRSKNIHGFFK